MILDNLVFSQSAKKGDRGFMRIKITYKTTRLPLVYRHRFMALIKESLERENPTYKKILYPDKTSLYSKKAKPFTFSVLLPSEKEIREDNSEKTFYFSKDVHISFLVSSFDYEFIVNLYNGLLNIKKFNIKDGIDITLKNIYLIKEKNISSEEAIFRTNSPILIEDKKERPVLPYKENLNIFNENLNAIQNRILKDIRGYGLLEPIELEPLRIRKTVVKHSLKGFKENTGKDFMTLTCFEGKFILKGNAEDLKLLYQAGIGLRTGQGFGMIDVV